MRSPPCWSHRSRPCALPDPIKNLKSKIQNSAVRADRLLRYLCHRIPFQHARTAAGCQLDTQGRLVASAAASSPRSPATSPSAKSSPASPITCGISPLALPTTGTAHAIASINTRPNCSTHVGRRAAGQHQHIQLTVKGRHLLAGQPRPDHHLGGDAQITRLRLQRVARVALAHDLQPPRSRSAPRTPPATGQPPSPAADPLHTQCRGSPSAAPGQARGVKSAGSTPNCGITARGPAYPLRRSTAAASCTARQRQRRAACSLPAPATRTEAGSAGKGSAT